MSTLLDNLCIVMVHTSHPGNIGSAARAMMTMGVSDLRLVNPNRMNSPETEALASGAIGIVQNAKVVESLAEAVSDCQYVVGTSARSERTLRWPQMNSRECSEQIAPKLSQQKVAIVFGRERSGLTNEELDHCHALVHIPMALENFSLNIASAVQVLCYECAMAVSLQNQQQEKQGLGEDLANAQQMEGFYQHLEQTLIDVRYLDPENPRLLMRRLRRLFNRVEVTQSEMNLLRGMLSAFQGRKFTKR